jgi:TRAP transporter 4TM/12TM fusion protein
MSGGLQNKLNIIFLIFTISFTLYLLIYYYLGIGGATLLAVTAVPLAFIIYVLNSLRSGKLYPKLNVKANYTIATLYVSLCILASSYIYMEFYKLCTVRMGSYNAYDVFMGAIMVLLIMEYMRREHFLLFLINVFLIIYTLYGKVFPGMFSHPGLSLTRTITALSVEFETGVFERLPQLALTTIGAFIFLVSIAQGFKATRSIVNCVLSLLGGSPRYAPQAAVLGSMAVGTSTGSGAANVVATGSFTIPLMKSIGIPGKIAGAIETSSSLGGQLVPPVMGVCAFIMADFLGVSYFDVMIRGFVPAVIYYAGIALIVHLVSLRYIKKDSNVVLGGSRLEIYDIINVAIFFSGLAILVYLMGVVMVAATYAAIVSATLIFIPLLLNYSYHVGRKSSIKKVLGEIWRCLMESIHGFSTLTSDLTLLLAGLAIMTTCFTITGIPLKIGFILMDVGGSNLLLLVALTFIFGYIVGLGLPPSATYILTAIVIGSHMVKLGFNPWVVHFYVFLLSITSELSPPTSIAAAAASKIAEASFIETMVEAMKISFPLYILMFALFTRPSLVIEPGLPQLAVGGIVLIGTLGLAFAIWGKFSKNPIINLVLKAILTLTSLITIFHSDMIAVTIAMILTLGLFGYGFRVSMRYKSLNLH